MCWPFLFCHCMFFCTCPILFLFKIDESSALVEFHPFIPLKKITLWSYLLNFLLLFYFPLIHPNLFASWNSLFYFAAFLLSKECEFCKFIISLTQAAFIPLSDSQPACSFESISSLEEPLFQLLFLDEYQMCVILYDLKKNYIIFKSHRWFSRTCWSLSCPCIPFASSSLLVNK